MIFPGEGRKPVSGILGVDAHFERVAAEGDLVLGEGQWLAFGDRDLQMHEVEAGDQLGDGVLDLEAGVDFEEVEVLFVVEQEFDRARVDVASFAREAAGGFAHAAAQVGADDGGGSFFDDLLMATLDGALTLAEIEDVAVLVGEELDFDVAGALDEFFEIDLAGAKGARGLVAGGDEGGGQLGWRLDGAHALAAAAGCCLEHDGIADFFGDLEGFVGGCEAADRAGGARHAGTVGGGAGAGFRAELAHGGGGRADEGDAGGGAGFGEVGVLGKESVAGMNGVRVAVASDFEDAVAAEIGVDRGRGAEAIGLVGVEDVKRGAVGVGVDGYGRDAELTAGPDEAECDFAAVGDEDLAQGCHQ